jgi:CelD/BcsL family acetyltransferase involved in cellulose biosynthesis
MLPFKEEFPFPIRSYKEKPMTIRPLSWSRYSVSIVQSLDTFQSLRDDWDALTETSDCRNMNLQHTWLTTWLEHFPKRPLFIVIVRNASGELVGAAPLIINVNVAGVTRRWLRHLAFVGTDPTVYDSMQFLVSRNEDAELVLSSIAEAVLQNDALWDVLDFRFLSDVTQLEVIRAHMSKKGAKKGVILDDILPEMSMPCFELPESVPTYQLQKKKSLRGTLNTSRNRLKREFPGEEVQFKIHEASTETDALMERFFERHIYYWQSNGVRSDFKKFPALKAFYKDIVRHYPNNTDSNYKAQFTTLSVGDKLMSVRFVFWQNGIHLDHICNYMDGFQPFSPGLMHVEAMIEQSIGMGGQLYQFGRGDETYKARWANKTVSLYGLMAYKNRWAYIQEHGDMWLKKLMRKP